MIVAYNRRIQVEGIQLAMKIQALVATLTVSLGVNLSHPALANQLAIQNAYRGWKASQLKAGNYLADSDCNMQRVAELIKAGRRTIQGFGTAAFSYGDINQDGIEDALVIFNPRQCDGGNALMNAQTAVLILSSINDTRYFVDDKRLESLKGLPNDMWAIFERVKGNGAISGTAYGYRDKDARCCPSIQAAFTYTYPTNKLRIN